jgi:hypothetical protein
LTVVAYVGLISVGLSHSSANVRLARTCTAEGCSNDVVVRRQVYRVLRLSAEHVDIVTLLHGRNIARHGCHLRVTFTVLADSDSESCVGHRCGSNDLVKSAHYCSRTGDSAIQVSFKVKSPIVCYAYTTGVNSSTMVRFG